MRVLLITVFDKGDIVTIVGNAEGHGIDEREWHKPHEVISMNSNSYLKVRGHDGNNWNMAAKDVKPFFKSRAEQASYIEELVMPFLSAQLEENDTMAKKLKEYETEEDELYAVLDKVIKSGGDRKKIESVLLEFGLVKPTIKQTDLSPTLEDDAMHPRQNRTRTRSGISVGSVYPDFTSSWVSPERLGRLG